MIPPSKILLKWLRDNGHAASSSSSQWFGTYRSMNDTPDDTIAVADSPPLLDGRLMRTGEQVEFHGIQIKARSADYDAVYTKLKSIRTALNGLVNDTVTVDGNQYRIHAFTVTVDVTYLGQEEKKKREMFVLNGLVSITPV